MAQALDWKLGKFFEWHTYLPYVERPRISPVFVIKTTDCYLELVKHEVTTYYYLYLKQKSEGTKLEPFSCSIHVTFNKSAHSSLTQKKWTYSSEPLVVFTESQFEDLEMSLRHGFTVRFLFALEQNVGLWLPISESKIDDKSMQTPPYLDAHISSESFSKDFAKLLDEGPNHDVEFTFGDQTIKAHKSILCCRSDVFTTMLKTKMVEGETGQINIQDMDASVFQQFLRCLYTGKLPELTVDIAMQLYAASDKYSIDTLKLQFAHFLMDNLSLENACEILALADQHNDPEFKKCVMEYIFKEKIPVGEMWPDFCKENQQLAIEVLNSFCRYLCEK